MTTDVCERSFVVRVCVRLVEGIGGDHISSLAVIWCSTLYDMMIQALLEGQDCVKKMMTRQVEDWTGN